MRRPPHPDPDPGLDEALRRRAVRVWRTPIDPALFDRVQDGIQARPRPHVALPAAGLVAAAVLLALGAWLVGPPPVGPGGIQQGGMGPPPVIREAPRPTRPPLAPPAPRTPGP